MFPKSLLVYPNGLYSPKKNHIIVNWGNGQTPKWEGKVVGAFLNRPNRTLNAINKIKAFSLMGKAGVSIPEWTTDKAVAASWLDDGAKVIARKTVTGTQGKGITIIDNKEDLHPAPLYTKYKKKKQEFRVHVFLGQVIDVQEKRKRKGVEANALIRTEGNGWVFCRGGVKLEGEQRDKIHNEAINSVLAVGLDFGGVDIIWNEHEKKAYVLEVNSAPGIEGTTVEVYAKALSRVLEINQ